VYTLGYPNHEVEASLNASLLAVYTDLPPPQVQHPATPLIQPFTTA